MRYYFILFLSAVSVSAEYLFNNFLKVIDIIAFFLAIVISGILLKLPTGIHALFLISTLILVLWLITLQHKNPSKFSFNLIKRKIEEVNGLEHRPLDAISDIPLGFNIAAKIWYTYIYSVRDKISKIRTFYRPKFSTNSKFTYYFSIISCAALTLSLVLTPSTIWKANIIASLTPKIEISFKSSAETTIELWVQPPAYVQKPAYFIISKNHQLDAGKVIDVVKGSQLKARAVGYKISPAIWLAGKRYEIANSKDKDNILSIDLYDSGKINIFHVVNKIGTWQVNVLPDTKPSGEIKSVVATSLYSTKIEYIASDDNGISQAEVLMTLPEGAKDTSVYKFSARYDNNAQDAVQTYIEDLTAHIWAGKKVEMQLRLTDNFDQTYTSGKVEFTLPEKKFSNPNAKKVANARKLLLLEPDNLSLRRKVADDLVKIAINPDIYKNNIVTFMALDSAIKRITGKAQNIDDETLQLLWNVAIQLEDGGLTSAQQKLYQALQKMQNSITNENLSNAEKQQLVAEVQQAIMEYLKSLASEMQSQMYQGKSLPSLPSKVAEKLQNSINMSELLQQMQTMADTDSYESLAKMADNLRNSIEKMDINQFEKMQEKQVKSLENMQELENIIDAQQKLLSQTNFEKDTEKVKNLKNEQERIRFRLNKTIAEFAKIPLIVPDTLEKADKEMGMSSANLEMGFATSSRIHQENALKALQQGSDEMAEQIAASIKSSMFSLSFMPQDGNYGSDFDPMGRKFNDDKATVPSKSDIIEVREIIEELRKRANDPQKNSQEKDYLDRLIH